MKKIKNLAAISLLILLAAGCSSYDDDNIYAASGKKSKLTAGINTAAPDNQVYTPPVSLYSTQFKTNSEGRVNNIKLSSIAIDNKVLQPDEVFSFNEAVGPTTEANGYMEAVVFNEGKEEKGFGGGVCQVSSTLYNAADEAGLEIIERHPHSKKVYYVPEDRDAATSYGSSDLKFKNTLGYPIKINSYIDNDIIYVEINKI